MPKEFWNTTLQLSYNCKLVGGIILEEREERGKNRALRCYFYAGVKVDI